MLCDCERTCLISHVGEEVEGFHSILRIQLRSIFVSDRLRRPVGDHDAGHHPWSDDSVGPCSFCPVQDDFLQGQLARKLQPCHQKKLLRGTKGEDRPRSGPRRQMGGCPRHMKSGVTTMWILFVGLCVVVIKPIFISLWSAELGHATLAKFSRHLAETAHRTEVARTIPYKF